MSVQRSGLIRFVTALWSLWFAAAFLELPGAHACAVHSGVSGHSHQTPAPETVHAHHHGAPQTEAPAHAAQCTCLSHCCGASPAVVAVPPAGLEQAARITPTEVVAPPAVFPASRPYVRPFANGPPVA